MGDSNVLKIPTSANVTLADHGEYCYSTSMKCCWKGTKQTSGCNSNYSSYSGCNRTVCNWTAGKEICENFNYAGKKWRLPTSSEVKKWLEYSFVVGSNGLQLCGVGDGNKTNLCAEHWNCKNNVFEGCMAYGFYVGDIISGGNLAMAFGIASGAMISIVEGTLYPKSIRCVTEME